MTFDLEKARATYSAGCAEDAANLVPDLIARIQELEDALVDERASRVYYEDSCPFRLWNDIKLKDKFLEKAKWQLQRGGKIRPNAKQHDHTAEFFRPNESPAKSWQITEEREEAFGRILRRLEYDQSLPGRTNYKIQRAMELLRAMLAEATR